MSLAGLPISFWGFALQTTTFPLNRAPFKVVEMTPYEMWTGHVPKLSFLRIWGYDAYVKHLISEKLSPKFDKSLVQNRRFASPNLRRTDTETTHSWDLRRM